MTSAVKTYGSHSDGELAHRVKGRRASVDELLDESRELGTRSPFTGEGISLLLGGNLAGEEKPEEGFGKGFLTAGSFGKGLLAFGDGLPAEADTLLCERGWVRKGAKTERRRNDGPASRTEPSQMRAGRPRMPLRGKLNQSWGSRERIQIDGPIELVDENGSERLLSVSGTRGFDLGRSTINMTCEGRETAINAVRTFSSSAGMSSATLSLREVALVEASLAWKAKALRRDWACGVRSVRVVRGAGCVPGQ